MTLLSVNRRFVAHSCAWLLSLPILTACSGVKFNQTEGSSQQIANICGLDDKSDSTGPKITTPPPGKYVPANITVEGTCEGTANVEISGGGLNAPMSVACVNGHFSQTLRLKDGDGMKDLLVVQAGVEGTGKRCMMLDTVPPAVQITPPASLLGNSNTLTVNGVCENGMPVELTQQGSTAAAVNADCVGGKFSFRYPASSGDGAKNLIARQTDEAGNRGQDDQQYMVDTVPPVIRITAPATDSIVKTAVNVAGTCETGLNVVIGGNSVATPVTTACLNGQFGAMLTLGNPDGQRTIIATQTDAAGNTGSDQRTVIRDTTAPMIRITAPAENTMAQNGLTVQGTCTDGLPVQISGAGVNAPSTVACNTSTFSAAIIFSAGDGVKNVIASQTDSAGNVGSDNRNFIKDATPPAITIANPAAGTVTRSTIALSGTCTNGFLVNIGGGALPATAVCGGGLYNVTITLSGADGTKNVTASQTDAAGNVGSANRNFVLDTSVPAITITAPAVNTEARTGVTLVGTCTNGLPIAVSGAGVNAPSTATCTNGGFSTPITFSNGDGVKNVVVAQTSAAGAMGSDNRNFIKDTTAPVIAITAPAANTQAQTGVTLVGTCTNGLPVNISGGVNAPSTTTCTNGAFSASITFSAGDGTKNIVASQTDPAGNVGSDNRNFIRNNTAPGILITAPVAGFATQGPIALQGTCVTGLPVNISGGIAAPVTTACTAGAFAIGITLTAPDGTKNIVAAQTDAAGNTGSDNRNFVLDTTAPVIAITAPAALTAAQTGVTLVGTCTTGLAVNISGTGVSAPSTTACTAGAFSQAITFSAGDGVKNVIVAQTDAAGNTGSDNRDFLRDTVAPVIAITAPAVGTSAQNGVTLVGTCTNGLPVNIAGAGVSAAVTTACNGGTFSAPVNFSAGDGTKNVVASQTDAAGNTGSDNRNFIRNNVAPDIEITAPAINTATRGPINLVGTCTNGYPVNISGPIAAPVTTACTAGAFAQAITLTGADGTKTISAAQTDAAGNTGIDNRNFILDTTAPVITITAPAAGFAAQTGLTLVGTCETGLTVNISGAGVSAPSTAVCTAGAFSAPVTFSAGEGTKNIVASQTDAAGNTGSANRDFVRDNTPPAIAITAPAAGTMAQAGVTLVGTCTTGLTVNISGAGVGAPSTTACTAGAFSQAITFSAGDGTKNVIASQTDAAGNTGSDNRNFVRNNVGPAIAITAPAANTATQGPINLVGTCTNGYPVNITGPIAAPVTTACTAGAFAQAITLTGADGTKTISAAQTDSAGNTGTDSRNFILDTTAPVIAITAPAALTAAQTGVTLVGTCETGLTVNISGAGVSAPSTTTCTAGAFSTPITFSAGEGTKNIIASQTDAAGNTGSANRDLVRDNTPPAIAITAPAAGTMAQTGVTLVGTCTTGLTVNISGAGVGSASTTTCTAGAFSTPITFSAGDGTKNVIASQTDAAGNTGSDNRNFVRNNVGPAIAITAPAVNTVTQGPINLVGTCTDGYQVNITGPLAATVTTACTAGAFSAAITLTGPDGSKTVTAAQTDTAGNTGSATRAFLLDTTAPVIAITAPAANTAAQTGLTVSGTCTVGLTVNLSGAGVNAPSTTTCASGTFSAAITFSAGEGTKNVIASQTDAAGNTGTDDRDFVRDNTPPAIAITAPAAGTEAQTGVTLVGTCTTGLTVNISGAGVGAASTTACTAGAFSQAITFSAGDGTKNVIVSQTDAAGNVGSDNRNFIRKNTAPVITITAPAVGTVTQGPLNLVGTCVTGLQVSITGAIAAPVTTACTAGAFSAAITLTGADGTKNVVATQTDNVGNTGSDNRNFVLDTAAPAITITAPAANSVTRSGLTLTGTCTAGLTVNIGGMVSAPSTTTCASGTFSANITLAAGDGTKNVIASQTDAAGNTGSANRNFILDTTAPVVRITAPAANTVAQNGLTVSGDCETGLTVVLSGAGISATTNTACTAGAFSQAIVFSAGDGAKNIVATQTDAAGNAGTDNRSFVRDATPPAITIAAPAANAITDGDLTISGTCETGLMVNIGGAVMTPGMAVCTNGTYSSAITLIAPDGTKNVVVSQTDAVGNTGSANRNFIRDADAPALRINAPAANTVTRSGLTLTGTCEAGLAVNITGGVTAPSSTACTGGNFSANITLAGPDGNKTVTVTQTDAAGNSGTDSRVFILDATAPVVQFTAPAAGTLAQATINVTGVCEAGLPVQLAGAGIGTAGPVSCTGGNFSANITFSNGDGSKVITATQTDAAGNTGTDSRTFMRDSTAPAVTITQPLVNAVTRGALTLVGACETGLTVNVGGAIAATTTSCTGGAYSLGITLSGADGTKNIVVTQTDAAGNTGSANRNFILDTTAPAVTIASPANGSTIGATFTLTGACEAGLALNITGSISAPSTTTCPAGGNYSVALTASAGVGTKTVTAAQTDAAGNSGSATASYSIAANPTATEVFTADASEGKVDILFVDDNSASMEFEQAKLGQRFPSFVNSVTALDWQIGITTTDCSTGTWGICGSLLPMAGQASPLLTAATPNYATVFSNTIYRPETDGCVARGECPSGNEQALLAARTAMDKRNTNNAGFFRDGAALAIVILTDEDEQSTGPATATTPQSVVDRFNSIWGTTKKFKSYAITVLAGDAACLQMQRDQQGGIGAAGSFATGLATLTGGQSQSICAADYSGILQQIGDDLRTVTSAVRLSRTPRAGTVSVTFTPARTITWTVSGNSILFNSPVPAGTQISVTYEY